MRRILVLAAGLLMVVSVAMGQEEPFEDIEDEEEEIEEIETFDRNVRLDFKMVPLEANDKGSFVVTAVPEYETAVSFKGEEGAMEFQVEGEIDLRDDGRIFVFYDAHLVWEGGEGEAEFHASSGVLLRSGRELEASRFGEKTLVIKASYIDEELKGF